MAESGPAPLEVTEDKNAEIPSGSSTAKKREQSSISFPYDDLNSAYGVAKGAYELGGKCAQDQLAAQLHYSGVDNGAFRVRVGTARIFGLVSVSRDGITLTPIGQAVVDPAREIEGRADAFLTVPLYKAIYDQYRGTRLPPPVGLERAFTDLGVSSKQTDRARQAFMRSAEQAGFFSQGRDRLTAPVSPAGTPLQPPKPDLDGGGGGSGSCTHPKILGQALVLGLVEALPPAGTEWDDSDRKQWVALAESIFKVVYKAKMLALPPGSVLSRNGDA
jgi:hypothetical protein